MSELAVSRAWKIWRAPQIVLHSRISSQLHKSICICCFFRNLRLPNNFTRLLYTTTCGLDGISRGPSQRVLSYVLFGQNKAKYSAGIERNLKLMRDLFPGYSMRLYHDSSRAIEPTSMDILCQQYCQDPSLDLCDASQPSKCVDIQWVECWTIEYFKVLIVEQYWSSNSTDYCSIPWFSTRINPYSIQWQGATYFQFKCTPFTFDYKCALRWNIYIYLVCFLQLTRSHPYSLPLVLCISYGTL